MIIDSFQTRHFLNKGMKHYPKLSTPEDINIGMWFYNHKKKNELACCHQKERRQNESSKTMANDA
jgi:hypothetical protein